MNNTVIAVVETTSAGIHPVSYETIAFAGIVSAITGHKLTVCVIGDNIGPFVDILTARTGYDVLGISVPEWNGYNSECHIEVLSGALADASLSYICIPHTARGIDFAPALAARHGGSCITGVEKVTKGENGVTFSRPLLNGKKVASVSPFSFPVVITVQPGVIKPEAAPALTKSGSPKQVIISYVPRKIECLGVKPSKADKGSLGTADVVVAAGNGIGDPENLKWIEQLAGRFSRSAMAGSRPVCDRQWLPYEYQVGVTGAVVRPKLYIACGISGATQHIAGMRESGFIVAINTDPNAAIRNHADIFISEDLRSFIPILLEKLSNSPY